MYTPHLRTDCSFLSSHSGQWNWHNSFATENQELARTSCIRSEASNKHFYHKLHVFFIFPIKHQLCWIFWVYNGTKRRTWMLEIIGPKVHGLTDKGAISTADGKMVGPSRSSQPTSCHAPFHGASSSTRGSPQWPANCQPRLLGKPHTKRCWSMSSSLLPQPRSKNLNRWLVIWYWKLQQLWHLSLYLLFPSIIPFHNECDDVVLAVYHQNPLQGLNGSSRIQRLFVEAKVVQWLSIRGLVPREKKNALQVAINFFNIKWSTFLIP